jgi:hypothetical protein
VSHNLSEPSRFLSRSTNEENQERRFVLFGYEKTGVPPTTYFIQLSSESLKFSFVCDEEESTSKRVEGAMDVVFQNASWSLLKDADCISKQR